MLVGRASFALEPTELVKHEDVSEVVFGADADVASVFSHVGDTHLSPAGMQLPIAATTPANVLPSPETRGTDL